MSLFLIAEVGINHNGYMKIVEEYLSLTLKWKEEYGEKTVVFMQVGSFFEIYALHDQYGKIIGSNLKEIASINDLVIANKSQKLYNKDVLMCGFGVNQIEKYLKKLQNSGYTVVIYTQEIQDKVITRKLAEIVSPGTYFISDAQEISNNITCIWIHKTNKLKFMDCMITIGISNIDIYTGKTTISQHSKYYEHNHSTYDDLERYISIYKPNECIIISNLSSKQINDVIEYTNIKSKKIHTFIFYKEEYKSNSAETESKSKSKSIIEPISNKKHINKLNINEMNVKYSEKQTYQREIIAKFFPNIKEDIFQTLTYNSISLQSLTFLLDF